MQLSMASWTSVFKFDQEYQVISFELQYFVLSAVLTNANQFNDTMYRSVVNSVYLQVNIGSVIKTLFYENRLYAKAKRPSYGYSSS